VRGFDARTGKRIWIFPTHIPRAGDEYGLDTWENDSLVLQLPEITGVWAQIFRG